jgi:hypothetical protein
MKSRKIKQNEIIKRTFWQIKDVIKMFETYAYYNENCKCSHFFSLFFPFFVEPLQMSYTCVCVPFTIPISNFNLLLVF